MRYSKCVIWLTMAAAMALPGASTLAAQDYYGRYNYRDVAHDYDRVNRLRADMERDQWRLNEALRCGRNREAQRIARDIDRDRRALEWQRRDIRRDLRRDYR